MGSTRFYRGSHIALSAIESDPASSAMTAEGVLVTAGKDQHEAAGAQGRAGVLSAGTDHAGARGSRSSNRPTKI